MTSNDRLVLLMAIAAAAVGLCGWFGWSAGLAVTIMATLMLAVGVGWGASANRKKMVAPLAVCFVVFSAVAVAMIALDDPAGAGEQWLGLPRATALLVSLLWPLGLIPGALYVRRFREDVLPEDRLEAFLSRYSRRP